MSYSDLTKAVSKKTNAEKISDAKKEAETIKLSIKKLLKLKNNGYFDNNNNENNNNNSLKIIIKPRRILKGHFGKIYACQWASDNRHIISASQDGKLIQWNGITQNKVSTIPLRNSWVMCCSLEQSNNRLASCGGLDNICSVYDLESSGSSKPTRELVGHTGYISSCSFVQKTKILTSSGDSTCVLWDLTRSVPIQRFTGHTADIMCASVTSSDSNNIFATASCDCSIIVWDIRSNKPVHSFVGNFTNDVNTVTFFPDSYAIGAGSEDCSCRIFDLRCWNQISCMSSPDILSSVQCTTFSRSGRLFIAGYDDSSLRLWDVLSTNQTPAYKISKAHESRVTCMSINKEGTVLSTGSWDMTLKCWA
jgi:guanine nucleotide-binding protein G(I)/G(S)/G(T) subunit beta-1